MKQKTAILATSCGTMCAKSADSCKNYIFCFVFLWFMRTTKILFYNQYLHSMLGKGTQENHVYSLGLATSSKYMRTSSNFIELDSCGQLRELRTGST